MTAFLDELQWRGLLHQTAGDGVEQHLSTSMRTAYCGFDPTADSLTIGNLLPIKNLMQWQRCGHQPIVLMGGGTGLIGDPSGRDAERALNTPEIVEHNIACQKKILERLLDFNSDAPNKAILVNNHEWLSKLSFIDVLRDVGKHFSVNAMIQRDSVKDRLENREQGISYTEFSYMLLQAYDFLHLYKNHNCTIQLAGSDQYGNIVSGMDLIRRHFPTESAEHKAYGITNKLVTKADGTKIGKSAGNAVWLSADKTSPYKFYQFWLNADDADVIKFLQWYTFLNQDEINELAAQHEQAPHERAAHKRLGQIMTEMIHGEAAYQQSLAASTALFGQGNIKDIDVATLGEMFEGVPQTELGKTSLGGDDAKLAPILVKAGLAESNKRAREFIQNGAVAINGDKVNEELTLNSDHLLHGEITLLKRGKKNWAMIRWA